MIELSFGGEFNEIELIGHIRSLKQDYIIQGQQSVTADSLTKLNTLEAWLRQLDCTNKDTKQADNNVIRQLVETGLFEISEGLFCPETKRKCKGLVLTKKSAKL